MQEFEITAPDGRRFIVTAPAGASQDEVLNFARQQFAAQPAEPQPEQGTLETLGRMAGNFGSGANRRIAEVAGAPFDLVNRGLRAVGVPIPEGRVADTFQSGINAVVGQPFEPRTGAERFARGAGSGVVDALTMLAPATAVAQGARAGTVAQGAAQAMASQPVTQGVAGAVGGGVGAATDNPMLGAAAAMATPLALAGARRALTPFPADNPQRAALVAAADAEGIRTTAGQRTGSRFLQNVESQFEQLPMTSGPQRAIREGQQADFTRAAARRMGEATDNLGPDNLMAARNRLGQQFDDLAARNTMNLNTPQAMQQLDTVLAELATDFTPDQAGPAVRRLRQMVERAQASGGEVPGTLYRRMDSEIGARMRNTGDPDLRLALGKVRDAFRNIMDDSISPDDAEAWQRVRRQYANYAVLRNAMSGAGEAAATGQVPPLQLRQALQQSVGREGYAEGRGDLNQLARIGQSVVRPPPDSGTAGRTFAGQLLTGGVGSGSGALLGALLGGPAGAGVGGAAGGVAPFVLPRVVQMAMNNPAAQAYLSNQMMPGGTRVNRELLAALLAQQGTAVTVP